MVDKIDLSALNLMDGAWYADDPHAIWAQLRATSPVHYDPVSRVWGISKHHDVLAIEQNLKTFSSHRAPRPHGDHLPMMISMDDPEHHRRRALVSRGFTPKRVADHLLRRMPDIRLAPGAELHRRGSNFVSGLEGLRVEFTPTPAEGSR